MNISPEFELLADKYGLDLNCNQHNYLNHVTQMAFDFWEARQPEIDKLKHDLANESCACRMFQYLLDKVEPVNLRYKMVRTLNPREFKQLVMRNINHGESFDGMVDELIKARARLPEHNPDLGEPK